MYELKLEVRKSDIEEGRRTEPISANYTVITLEFLDFSNKILLKRVFQAHVNPNIFYSSWFFQ